MNIAKNVAVQAFDQALNQITQLENQLDAYSSEVLADMRKIASGEVPP